MLSISLLLVLLLILWLACMPPNLSGQNLLVGCIFILFALCLEPKSHFTWDAIFFGVFCPQISFIIEY